MKTIVKIPLGIICGLLIVAAGLFTMIGGWRLVPKTLEWHRILKRVDWSELAHDSCDLIRKCPAQGMTFEGNSLTNTPKSIQALDPISVDVMPNQMTIVFEQGAEGWGLSEIENNNAWLIRSWPHNETGKYRVDLSFKKDPKSGKPVGEPIGTKPSAK